MVQANPIIDWNKCGTALNMAPRKVSEDLVTAIVCFYCTQPTGI